MKRKQQILTFLIGQLFNFNHAFAAYGDGECVMTRNSQLQVTSNGFKLTHCRNVILGINTDKDVFFDKFLPGSETINSGGAFPDKTAIALISSVLNNNSLELSCAITYNHKDHINSLNSPSNTIIKMVLVNSKSHKL